MFARFVNRATRPHCPACHRTYDDVVRHCSGCGRELATPVEDRLPWRTVASGRSRYLLEASLLASAPLVALAGLVAVRGPSSTAFTLSDTAMAVVGVWYALVVCTFFLALASAPAGTGGD